MDYDALMKMVLPLALVIGGLVTGLVFEKIVIKRIKKLSSLTKWEGDDIVIKASRGAILLLFTIAGVYGAVIVSPISPEMLALVQKIILAIVIVLGTVVLARMADDFVRLYSNKLQGVLPSTSIFAVLTRILIFSIGILIVLQSLGIPVTPILTALGVGGLAVALALQDTLSNLFSGLHLIVSGQVKLGDYVKLDSGEEGHVTDISWRNTTIKALPNNMIVVPNYKLASAIITNYNSPQKEMSVYVPVGVSYDSDLNKVEEVTVEVAKDVMTQVKGGVPEHEPVVRYNEFADSSINFIVVLRAKDFSSQYLIKHEFIKRLHERYRKENIEIPFPIRTVYLKGEKE